MIFHAQIGLVFYSATEGCASEHATRIFFEADNDVQAVKDAARFAKKFEARYKAYCEKDCTFAFLKVHTAKMHKIDENGELPLCVGGQFFEWKYDRPYTLEEKIAEFERAKGRD